MCPQVCDEARAVRVAADDLIAGEQKRIHRARPPRRLIHAGAQRQRGFLVRNGHVGATKSRGVQPSHGFGEMLRRHR